jgi:N-acetylglucosaminyldiphosphoundecaprenol N-acetyl-beta-D-mannosaminyltransferase
MLAAALAPLCPGVGLLCVGAALDFISAEVSRAPSWVQRVNMEWAWRLAGDPKRLATRYARCAVRLAEVGAPALLAPPKRITTH